MTPLFSKNQSLLLLTHGDQLTLTEYWA
jgi:hypothetical protein